MALRVGLLVEAEFLRLVLRQLLRRIAGVELLGDATTAAEARDLPAVDILIAEITPCAADPPAFAALSRAPNRRLVLVGDGEVVHHPGLIIAADMIRIPIGTATTARDLSVFGSRLRDVIRPMAERATKVGQGSKVTAGDPAVAGSPRTSGRARRPELILIAASTGGPDALQALFTALHSPVCPIVIALHIPAEHCAGLARHLAAVTGHRITVGEAGPLPRAGIVLLPGGMDHAVAKRIDGLWLRRVRAAESVFHPNGDVLLSSGAELDRAVVGIVLTGMGSDGSAGAAALAGRGYPVLAQSPGTCAVPGMPGAAIAGGSVREVASPAGIADRLNVWFDLPAAE